MSHPAWLPRRADVHGILLALAIGILGEILEYLAPTYQWVGTDILIATLIGAVIGNTPLRRLVGHTLAGEGDGPASTGLRYVSTWVVRLAVMLLGLKLRARFFRPENLLTIASIAAISIPGAFFVSHVVGKALGLRRPLVDIIAGGTMICGASAVGAIGPVVRAEQEEQSVAVATIFLYSILAMFLFRPIAMAIHLSSVDGGLWCGLAINDFASALTAGRLLDIESTGGTVMVAMAKSSRVMLLVPTVAFFQWLRRTPSAARSGGASGAGALVPGYLIGYLAMGFLRVIGDRFLPDSNAWHRVITIDSHLSTLAILMMAATLGLYLDVRRLLGTSIRAVLTGASASLWTTGIVLFLLVTASSGRRGVAAGVGIGALAITALLYRLVAVGPATSAIAAGGPEESSVVAPGAPGPPPAPARRARRLLLPAMLAAMVGGLLVVLQLPRAAPPQVVSAIVPPIPPGALCPEGMALVPEGDFMFGTNDGFDTDEMPVRRVHIPSFCLGIHEVTVREYSACVAEGACSPGRMTADWPNLSLLESFQWSRYCNHDTPDRQDHPMNCVDWYQSDVYCRARGGRLASEAEWEYAARGGAEQRRYPWGDETPDNHRANCCGPECLPMTLSIRKEWGTLYPESDGFMSTAPVGSFPTGAGRWGHLDLTCNVAEWTLDAYCPYDEPDCGSDERTVRGDGYQTCAMKKVRAARRNHDEPWHRSPDLGMRCMRPLAGSSLAPPSIQPAGAGSDSSSPSSPRPAP